jgi:hypothetical protein
MSAPYMQDKEIPLELLERLFAQLKEARVSPLSLYAYAHALDVLESHKETQAEEPEETWEVADQYLANLDCARDDWRDDVDTLYSGIREMLIKMGYMPEEE